MYAVHIGRFKSLEDIQLYCGNLISLIGENNSGKSNLLEALDLFFNPSVSKITEESFFQKDVTKPIEITIEFIDLNEWETKYFAPWMDENKLRVKRIISWSDEPQIDNIAIVKIPEPEWLRLDSINGSKIAEWWKDKEKLELNGLKFHEYLGSKKPTVESWKEAVSRFLSEHKSKVPYVEEERKNPVGYAGVLKGGLPAFIPVPAVRYVAEELKVGKTNPFGQLISLILERIPTEHKEAISRAIEKVRTLINRTEEAERVEAIRGLEKQLQVMLCSFMECDVEIEIPLPDLQTMFRGVKIYIDDGFRTSLETKGHGLQRSFIFAILRVYVELIRKGSIKEEEKEKSIIFAIEEPELYLHPQAQRSMMQALREIAEKRDQVIYSTHSSLFVDIMFFDQICLMRREIVNGNLKSTVTQLSMEDLIRDLKFRYPETEPTPESMRERYSHVYTTARNEGFFARKVVLVEGPTEEYVLPVYFGGLGYDMDKEGVSVISSGGKNQIDRLLRVFNEFRIPCYIMFDGDRDSDDTEVLNATSEILNLMNWTDPVPPPTTVEDKFAVFEKNFEETMKEQIPDYTGLVTEAKKRLGIKIDTGKPLIARYIAKKLAEKGEVEGNPGKYVPPIIYQILEKVKEIKWEGSILRKS